MRYEVRWTAYGYVDVGNAESVEQALAIAEETDPLDRIWHEAESVAMHAVALED